MKSERQGSRSYCLSPSGWYNFRVTADPSKFLAVDMGNTNITFGVFDEENLLQRSRMTTRPRMTSDEIALFIDSMILKKIPGIAGRAMIASVVPQLDAPLSLAVRKSLDIVPETLVPGPLTPFNINYSPPADLGADRLANAWAVRKYYRKNAVVVDFGTATTFDIVGADGEYNGGIILPGILSSLENLFEKAAKLPHVDFRKPPRLVSDNTVESIQSGAFHGLEAALQGLLARIRKTHPYEILIFTGGLSRFLERNLSIEAETDPDLTLKGIHAAANPEN